MRLRAPNLLSLAVTTNLLSLTIRTCQEGNLAGTDGGRSKGRCGPEDDATGHEHTQLLRRGDTWPGRLRGDGAVPAVC